MARESLFYGVVRRAARGPGMRSGISSGREIKKARRIRDSSVRSVDDNSAKSYSSKQRTRMKEAIHLFFLFGCRIAGCVTNRHGDVGTDSAPTRSPYLRHTASLCSGLAAAVGRMQQCRAAPTAHRLTPAAEICKCWRFKAG